MVKIILSRRLFYILIGVFLILIIAFGVGVYALGGTTPDIMGHTMGEVHPSCSGILLPNEIDNHWYCISLPPECVTSPGSPKSINYDSLTKKFSCSYLDLEALCP